MVYSLVYYNIWQFRRRPNASDSSFLVYSTKVNHSIFYTLSHRVNLVLVYGPELGHTYAVSEDYDVVRHLLVVLHVILFHRLVHALSYAGNYFSSSVLHLDGVVVLGHWVVVGRGKRNNALLLVNPAYVHSSSHDPARWNPRDRVEYPWNCPDLRHALQRNLGDSWLWSLPV